MQLHTPETPHVPDVIDLDESLHWGHAIARSPWLWGGLLTFGFYAAIPSLTFGRELIQRYCSSHWVEYLEVGLFLVGMVVLIQKAFALRHEFAAFQVTSNKALGTETGPALEQLRGELNRLPDQLLDTVWSRRMRGIGRFLKERISASGLKDQLKFFSDTAADSLHDSHSLLQTIIWAIPIMGFLGTVLGITLAIANVTPEKLDTSLPEVTSGLAVAFDTTAVALLFSLALVFGSLFVKRNEDTVLSMAEETALGLCGQLIDGPAAPESAIMQAEQDSARRLIESTGSLIQKQSSLWQESLDTLRERWSNTISAHEQLLGDSLRTGAEASLASHQEQLASLRQEFLTACQLVSHHVSSTIEKIEDDRLTHDAARQQELEHWTTLLREDIGAAARQQQWHLRNMLDEFASRLESWQGSFQQLASASESQATQLSQHSSHLARIVGHEEQLAGLQLRLNENLESLRGTETFEESLLNLNAAISLLTARVHSRAA